MGGEHRLLRWIFLVLYFRKASGLTFAKFFLFNSVDVLIPWLFCLYNPISISFDRCVLTGGGPGSLPALGEVRLRISDHFIFLTYCFSKHSCCDHFARLTLFLPTNVLQFTLSAFTFWFCPLKERLPGCMPK